MSEIWDAGEPPTDLPKLPHESPADAAIQEDGDQLSEPADSTDASESLDLGATPPSAPADQPAFPRALAPADPPAVSHAAPPEATPADPSSPAPSLPELPPSFASVAGGHDARDWWDQKGEGSLPATTDEPSAAPSTLPEFPAMLQDAEVPSAVPTEADPVRSEADPPTAGRAAVASQDPRSPEASERPQHRVGPPPQAAQQDSQSDEAAGNVLPQTEGAGRQPGTEYTQRPIQPEPLHPIRGLRLHATQAHHHVQQGFGAANRGMLYTARKEFLEALRIVAEAKDAHDGHRASMDALAAGLAALEEAEGIREASSAVAKADLSLVIAAHRTPVLRGENVSEMLPLAAIDQYHAYAQEQLGRAVAGDPSGSMALYGLARIYEHLGSENGADRVARSRQAVALHKAALLAHPENPLAAHELGVVLTKLGQYHEAIAMLTRSIQLAPSSKAYHNLAVASRHCGRLQQAATAERYAVQMAQREAAAGVDDPRVAWLDPSEFARTSERALAPHGTAPQARPGGAGQAPDAAEDHGDSGERRAWWKLPTWR